MSEPVWLTTSEIIEINARIVARTDEPSFVKDWNALESAADRPRNAFAYGQDDIVYLAAMTSVAIAQGHPFMQGNKRTALIGMQVFLQNNGFTFEAPDVRQISQLIYDVVEHRLDVDGLADAIDQWIVELDESDADWATNLLEGMPEGSVSMGMHYEESVSINVEFDTNFGEKVLRGDPLDGIGVGRSRDFGDHEEIIRGASPKARGNAPDDGKA